MLIKYAVLSASVPVGSPGKTRFRFLPSSGTIISRRAQKPWMLTGCIIIRQPVTCSGSISRPSSIAAAIPGYSPPWMPAVISSVGPSFSPLIIVRGIFTLVSGMGRYVRSLVPRSIVSPHTFSVSDMCSLL